MRQPDTYCPLTISDYINNRSDVFPEASRHVAEISNVQSMLRSLLGPPMADHLNVANYSNDTLTLHTDSPAWASRLRFNIQTLLNIARIKCGLRDLKSIRIRVMIQNTDVKSVNRSLHMSEKASKTINDTVASINDNKLQNSLANLAKHYV